MKLFVYISYETRAPNRFGPSCSIRAEVALKENLKVNTTSHCFLFAA